MAAYGRLFALVMSEDAVAHHALQTQAADAAPGVWEFVFKEYLRLRPTARSSRTEALAAICAARTK